MAGKGWEMKCLDCDGTGKTTHRKQGIRFATHDERDKTFSWDDEIVCELCKGSGTIDKATWIFNTVVRKRIRGWVR